MNTDSLKKIGKIKIIGQGTGVIGVFISLIQAFQTFLETFDVLQLVIDVTIVFLTLDRQIAQNVESLKEAGGFEFIIIGLGIYGKIWVLLILLKLLSKPIIDTAVSDDMPAIPIFLVKLMIFILVMTPLVFIGQLVGLMLEQGSMTLADIKPPWIGLYSIIVNMPLLLQVIVEVIDVVIKWIEFFADLIPFFEIDQINLDTQNTSINNTSG